MLWKKIPKLVNIISRCNCGGGIGKKSIMHGRRQDGKPGVGCESFTKGQSFGEGVFANNRQPGYVTRVPLEYH